MGKLKVIVSIVAIISVLVALTPSFVFAVPQQPMQFYGEVSIGGAPAPDGIQIEAKITGITYLDTTTKDGKYGYEPVFLFPADDPDTVAKEGAVNGDMVEFYVGGALAATAQFNSGDIKEFDLGVMSLAAPTAPVNIGRTTQNNDNTPTFSWDAPTKVPGVVAYYKVKIDSQDWISLSNITTYTPSSNLADGSDHTFQVRAVDKLAQDGTAGTLNFTIDVTPPTTPDGLTKITPDSDNTPTFRWEASTDITSDIAFYERKIDTGAWKDIGDVNVYTINASLADGTHTFEIRAIDSSGNNGTAASINFTIDITPPSTPTGISKTTIDNDSTPTFTWTAPTDITSGIASYEIRLNGGDWVNIGNTTSYTVSGAISDGSHFFQVRAKGVAGNIGNAGNLAFSIDTASPTTPTNLVKTTPDRNNLPTFNWSDSTDTLSGIVSYEVRVDSGDWTNTGNVTTYTVVSAVSDGSRTFEVRAKDAAGNTGTAGSIAFTIDATSPSTPANISRSTTDTDDTPTFTWDASADATSGVASYEIKIDSGIWTGIGAVVTYTLTNALPDGSHTFQVRAKDAAGNSGAAGSLDFDVDTAPEGVPGNIKRTTSDMDNTPVFIWDVVATATYEVSIDGAWVPVGNATTYEHTTTLSDGPYTFSVRATPAGGAPGAAGSLAFTIDITPPTVPAGLASTTLNSDNTPDFTWSASADATSGVVSYEVRVDSGDWIDAGNVITYTSAAAIADGSHVLQLRAKDAAGNSGTAASLNITIDVTPPAVPETIIMTTKDNDNTPTFTWIAVTDTTSAVASYEVRIDSGDWVNLGSILNYTSAIALSDGAHTMRVRAKDTLGHTGSAGSLSFIIDTTPPAPPASIVKTTPDNNSIPTFNWTAPADAASGVASYEVRVDSGAWTNISNLTTYTHSVSIADGNHTFQVRAKDTVGNTGSAGSLAFVIETVSPVVTITSPNGGELWAGIAATRNITWTTIDTNRFLVSISYSTDGGYNWSPVVSVAADTGSYSWMVPHVDTSTARIGIIATDQAGNSGSDQSDASFTIDSTPPVISNVSASGITATSVVISWSTGDPASTQVEYGLNTEYGKKTMLIPDLAANHSVSLSGLTPETTYHYRARSLDGAGNEATSLDNSFTTSPQVTNIVFSEIAASKITATGALITWTTGLPATSQVEYGLTESYGSATQLDNSTGTGHTVSLTGLIPGAVYHYRVKSSGAISGDYTFTTTGDTVSPVPSGITVTNIASSSAVVWWNTNEPAASQVVYDSASHSTGVPADYQWVTSLDAGLVLTHGAGMTGLTPDTTYYYRVLSKDAAGNESVSSEQSFTTLPDTTLPVISSVVASAVTTNSAVISWSTSEPATSRVVYHNASHSTGVPGDYQWSTSFGSILRLSHSAGLGGLSPNTTYYYRVVSGDAGNNQAVSGELSFTTLQDNTPPSISGIVEANVNNSSAIILWLTGENATSKVVYDTTSYASAGEYTLSAPATPDATTDSTSHGVALSGLTGNTTYYYRVVSADAYGNQAVSDEYTFTTVDTTPPAISRVNVISISSGAVIIWVTDEDATSQVEYGTASGSYGSSTSLDTTLVSSHGVVINGLYSGNTYYYRIISKDASGNETVSGEYLFTNI